MSRPAAVRVSGGRRDVTRRAGGGGGRLPWGGGALGRKMAGGGGARNGGGEGDAGLPLSAGSLRRGAPAAGRHWGSPAPALFTHCSPYLCLFSPELGSELWLFPDIFFFFFVAVF